MKIKVLQKCKTFFLSLPETFPKKKRNIQIFSEESMAGCYIIYSEKLNKFYIGSTHEEISKRIEKHNQCAYGKHRFTSTASDWKLFLYISCRDNAHAVRVERKIKSMKSVVYIRNLEKYPELVEKLISST